MLAGNADRIADGEPPLEPTPAQGSDDVHAADGPRPDPPVPVDGDAAPLDRARRTRSASSASRSTRATSGTALPPRSSAASRSSCSAPRDLWRAVARDRGRARTSMRAARLTFRLIHLADIVAVTRGASCLRPVCRVRSGSGLDAAPRADRAAPVVLRSPRRVRREARVGLGHRRHGSRAGLDPRPKVRLADGACPHPPTSSRRRHRPGSGAETSCGAFTLRLDQASPTRRRRSFARPMCFSTTRLPPDRPRVRDPGRRPDRDRKGGPGYTTVDTRRPEPVHAGASRWRRRGRACRHDRQPVLRRHRRRSCLPPDYAVLGKVVEGLDVVARIGKLGTRPSRT